MHSSVCSKRWLWGVLLALVAPSAPLGAQDGAGSVTGRVTETSTGLSCELTGTASLDAISLNLVSCDRDCRSSFVCDDGTRHDLCIVARSFIGDLSESRMQGSYAETSTTFRAGTELMTGVVSINGTFAATR